MVNGVIVPVYYLFVPKDYPKLYVVVQGINSTGRESKNDQDRETSIQFAISTRMDLNSGWECDQIANRILELCYPNRETVVPGCLSMQLISDNTIPDYDPAAKKQIVERIITFSHIITS